MQPIKINLKDNYTLVIQERKGTKETFVDFRKWFTDAEGELRPTGKGIVFTKAQWNDVLKNVGVV